MRWLDGITNSTDMNLSRLWKTVKDRGPWCAAVHGAAKSESYIGTAKAHLSDTLNVKLGSVSLWGGVVRFG